VRPQLGNSRDHQAHDGEQEEHADSLRDAAVEVLFFPAQTAE